MDARVEIGPAPRGHGRSLSRKLVAVRSAGFLLQPTYRLENGRPVLQLFGRLSSGDRETPGPAFLVEDDRFRPYAFVAADAEPRLRRERGLRIEPCGLRDLRGRAVLRVETETPAGVARLRERLGGDVVLEADIRFPYRVLIDLGIRSGLAIDGEPARRGALLVFRNPDLAPAHVEPRVRVVSLDLETTPDAGMVFAAALVGDGVDEVHVVAPGAVAGALAHRDETGLLRALVSRIAALDPDVLVGWNVVDFDLRVLAARCAALGVAAEIGRAPGAIAFQEDRGFTRQSRALIPGRMVLDGVGLVRDALRLPDYRLETAAQAVLGRGKLLDREVPDAMAEIQRLHREDPAALAAYNREDARLVVEILEREGLLALAVERSLLSGMQLDRVGASIASFDLLYLPELRRRGFVAPSVEGPREPTPAGDDAPLVKGGALLDPVPGFHERVAVFDFRSLYPSLIRSFDLDPLAHALAAGADDEDVVTAPNGARFLRGAGILPKLVERFAAARTAARARGDAHAAQAIKIMLNALFGVLGAGACRFFDPAVANAITSFGQQTLRWTRDAFAELGVPVLYGDTDSVFVRVESRAAVEPLRERAEARIAQRIRGQYRVEPHLSLESQSYYERFFLPRLRGGRGASHKRYAGLEDGKVVTVGLESVRRDWPAVAARLQQGMLERAFGDRPVAPFVRELVEQVEGGALDAELVYVRRVRKGSLDRYTATTPPHVQAARRLVEQGVRVGPVVRYVVTACGPEPVLPGRPLPDGIDRRYYVEHVLRPVADAILIERGETFDDAIGRPKPKQLELL
jgi:DNA polymerase-2